MRGKRIAGVIIGSVGLFNDLVMLFTYYDGGLIVFQSGQSARRAWRGVAH